MKPHYRLHFHLFDGKTPLWWVSKRGTLFSTGGYVDPARAIFEATHL